VENVQNSRWKIEKIKGGKHKSFHLIFQFEILKNKSGGAYQRPHSSIFPYITWRNSDCKVP
jgi:hypothetical protein